MATAIGLVFGASALVGALLSPIAGFFGDRFGFKRVLVGSTLLATTVAEDSRSTALNLSYVPLYVAGLTGGTLGALLARLNLSLVPLTGAVFALTASLVALRAIRPGA